MTASIPHPFPVRIRDQVNSELRKAGIVDETARYTARRLIADAYAEGFNDGNVAGTWDAFTDASDKADAE